MARNNIVSFGLNEKDYQLVKAYADEHRWSISFALQDLLVEKLAYLEKIYNKKEEK